MDDTSRDTESNINETSTKSIDVSNKQGKEKIIEITSNVEKGISELKSDNEMKHIKVDSVKLSSKNDETEQCLLQKQASLIH